MSAPYAPDTAAALTGALTHVVRVQAVTTAGTFALDLRDGTLTYDEGWTPYVQASITCAIPSQDILDALDPRTLPRLEVRAGYVRDDGTEDVHLVASLVIRDRTVLRPQGHMVIAAESDECLLIDAGVVGPLSLEYPGVQAWGLVAVLAVMLRAATGIPPALVATTDAVVDVEIGWTDRWADIVATWVDQGEAWLRHDGLTGWRLDARPDVVSTSALVLATGPGGIITGSQAILTREGDQWASDVWTYHTWKSAGVDYYRAGHAWISGGQWRAYAVDPTPGDPAGTVRPGIKRLIYERTGAVTSAQAHAAARALLARRASGGRRLSIDAVAAWWLRPGDTVTIQLPTGPQERHLVSSVAFRFPAGDMTVHTRLPDIAPITSGE